jgi:hypothetical protein
MTDDDILRIFYTQTKKRAAIKCPYKRSPARSSPTSCMEDYWCLVAVMPTLDQLDLEESKSIFFLNLLVQLIKIF